MVPHYWDLEVYRFDVGTGRTPQWIPALASKVDHRCVHKLPGPISYSRVTHQNPHKAHGPHQPPSTQFRIPHTTNIKYIIVRPPVRRATMTAMRAPRMRSIGK